MEKKNIYLCLAVVGFIAAGFMIRNFDYLNFTFLDLFKLAAVAAFELLFWYLWKINGGE